MNHAPFIWAAYGIGALVLAWCAIAPMVRKKSAVRDIVQLVQAQGRRRPDNERSSNDTDA